MNTIKRSLALTITVGLALLTKAQTGTYSWANLPKVQVPTFKKDTINITRFGARPDGITLNTEAINKAIEACSKQGGWCGVHTARHLAYRPCCVKKQREPVCKPVGFSTIHGRQIAVPMIESHFEGKKTVRNQAPISGTDLENVAITGEGVIDGNGDVWRTVKKDKVTEGEWKKLVASGGVLSADGRQLVSIRRVQTGRDKQKRLYVKYNSRLRSYQGLAARHIWWCCRNCKKGVITKHHLPKLPLLEPAHLILRAGDLRWRSRSQPAQRPEWRWHGYQNPARM